MNRDVCKILDCHIMNCWTKQARLSTFDTNISKFIGNPEEESRSFRNKMLHISTLDIINEGEADLKGLCNHEK